MADATTPLKGDGVPRAAERERAPKSGFKRDRNGNPKANSAPVDGPRNAYTSMFEGFRDELDEHHDRRQKIITVSKDVTALSKKIIFSLQRVRKLNEPVPERIASEIKERVQEIKERLGTVETDLRGINRYRYGMSCLEEFIEAIALAHYLEHQTLVSPATLQDSLPANIALTGADYVLGLFDLTGEMMRFATAVTALTGAVPTGQGVDDRNILTDLQNVASMLQIVPPHTRGYGKKVDVMVEQVKKVERLGYGVTVRGGERPKGWMPDMNEASRDETEAS